MAPSRNTPRKCSSSSKSETRGVAQNSSDAATDETSAATGLWNWVTSWLPGDTSAKPAAGSEAPPRTTTPKRRPVKVAKTKNPTGRASRSTERKPRVRSRSPFKHTPRAAGGKRKKAAASKARSRSAGRRSVRSSRARSASVATRGRPSSSTRRLPRSARSSTARSASVAKRRRPSTNKNSAVTAGNLTTTQFQITLTPVSPGAGNRGRVRRAAAAKKTKKTKKKRNNVSKAIKTPESGRHRSSSQARETVASGRSRSSSCRRKPPSRRAASSVVESNDEEGFREFVRSLFVSKSA